MQNGDANKLCRFAESITLRIVVLMDDGPIEQQPIKALAQTSYLEFFARNFVGSLFR